MAKMWRAQSLQLSPHRGASDGVCREFRRLSLHRSSHSIAARFPILAATETTEAQTVELQIGQNAQRLSKIITEGRVTVNGECVTVPQTIVRFKSDRIVVDGERIRGRPPQKFYFAVHKPRDYVCTSQKKEADGKGSKIVLDFFEKWLEKWKARNPDVALPPRLFTVGRLDKQSRGLIFVTNDGKWAQKVAHPSTGLTKEYVVQTKPEAKMRHIRVIAEGCEVDGEFVQPVGVLKENDYLRIVVAEGRNREVRTLVENSGLQVSSLKRVRIGGYRLPPDLKLGEIRALRAHERRRLMDLGAQTTV